MKASVKISKIDGRCKGGKKFFAREEITFDNDEQADRELAELQEIYGNKFIVEVTRYKTVKSLMSGKDVEIAADTPICCDPSSDTYWSM